jgi:peptidoglycan/xylan/chitin deacetylase (PgdA/CDA1 family)
MALGSLVRLVQRAGKPDRLGCYERWIDAAAGVGAKATWFFLPGHYSRPHPYDIDYTYYDEVTFAHSRMTVAEMIKQLRQSGAEIGLHGSYLSFDDSQMLSEQRLQLESSSGAAVRSIRQHYLKFDAAATIDAQQIAGFYNDSTVGFNEAPGFRAKSSFPFFLWSAGHQRRTDCVEVPLVLMDGHLRSMIRTPEQAIHQCERILATVAKVGGCLTINWHPNHVNNPTYWSAFRYLIEGARQRDAWFATIGEVGDFWRREFPRVRPSFESTSS